MCDHHKVAAKQHFETAIECGTGVTDLLEFHYAELLHDLNEHELAEEYMQKAVEKGEQEAIQKMKG